MATTGTNFFAQTSTAAGLKGTTVAAGPKIYAVSENDESKLQNKGQQASLGVPIDYQVFDLRAVQSFAKNGAVLLALSGTTLQTIDLTNTTTNTPQDSAGDTAFSTVSQLVFVNHGGGNVTVAPGGSNGLVIFGGTTPTYVVPDGKVAVLTFAAKTVDSTHKTIDFTPSATCNFSVAIGGA